MTKWQDLEKDGVRCPPACGLPAGFFRVRYFHGKQMRLADYVDEQRYHAGKNRFHNEKLHGAGVLCGLQVTSMQPDAALLRVARGAAIDDCGREIVVGWDQCIDVEGWFQEQRQKPYEGERDPCEPDQDHRVRLCVVMRYAECVGAPEPKPATHCAPPSGCDCGAGGECSGDERTCHDPCSDVAEFGRTTEEFEMRLMFFDESKAATQHALFPTKDAIVEAIVEARGGIGLLPALNEKVRQGCPSSDEAWLLLACFYIVLDADDPAKILRIEDIDYTCASQPLLSTEVIQYLLANLYADADVDIGGPEISKITFRKVTAKIYQIEMALTAPVVAASLDADDSFGLRRLTEPGWRAPANNVVSADYAESASGDFLIDGPAIYLTIDNSGDYLVDGGRYHLFSHSDANPVVDDLLRRLRPRHLLYRFGLALEPNTGDLTMTDL